MTVLTSPATRGDLLKREFDPHYTRETVMLKAGTTYPLDRQFTAEYKEHTGSSDSNTLTWQIILTMPRPADFPSVGGVSGTVTVNLANLPASAGDKAVVVPVEAVFNPDNRQRNEPHVWVVKGEGEQLQLEDRKVGVGQVTSQGVVITEGLSVGERVVAAGVSELHAQQPVRIWTRERGL